MITAVYFVYKIKWRPCRFIIKSLLNKSLTLVRNSAWLQHKVHFLNLLFCFETEQSIFIQFSRYYVSKRSNICNGRKQSFLRCRNVKRHRSLQATHGQLLQVGSESAPNIVWIETETFLPAARSVAISSSTNW